jgi:hypothetical protein
MCPGWCGYYLNRLRCSPVPSAEFLVMYRRAADNETGSQGHTDQKRCSPFAQKSSSVHG